MAEGVDQVARDLAQTTHAKLDMHVQSTELKLNSVAEDVRELKSFLKWVGGIIVMLFISTLTWSLAQQYNANEAMNKDMKQQIELLKEQERARNVARSEILSRLPTSGAETSGAPLAGTEVVRDNDVAAGDRR